MNKKQIAITLGIMCLILTLGTVIQIKTINGTGQVVSQNFSNNELRDQVLRWKERYDTTLANLQNAETKLEQVRATASANTEGSEEKEAELKKNNMLLGLTDVTGEGVIVTLKDNDAVDSTKVLDSSYLLVHDSDLLGIVNELKNGGAEAISINGERIVSTSSITCEGNVISINGEKISSPFVIKAIGRPTMYSALSRPGGTIEYLNSRIIATISQESNITIDKYSGVISARYMQYDE